MAETPARDRWFTHVAMVAQRRVCDMVAESRRAPAVFAAAYAREMGTMACDRHFQAGISGDRTQQTDVISMCCYLVSRRWTWEIRQESDGGEFHVRVVIMKDVKP